MDVHSMESAPQSNETFVLINTTGCCTRRTEIRGRVCALCCWSQRLRETRGGMKVKKLSVYTLKAPTHQADDWPSRAVSQIRVCVLRGRDLQRDLVNLVTLLNVTV